ncbi:hypothetical protein AX774_g258 [Zancudomyces culisetae]|uniref:Uncharacterized protein n=1 Tax=Zancudomyces culisetae TaxID=1213189 RepID=A0A1R1PZ22_ZANCU|nr:hypothetical protein AX774_g258 [Zancudomyces culisetae]|eukprot:OMH86185.1 hypothetical protein AX774_g258 [Zancudomyces culisetae]
MRVEAMIQHLTQLGGTVPQLPPLPTAGAATMLTSSSTMASRMVDGNQIPYYNNGYQYYNNQAQQMQQRNNSTGEFQHTLSYSDFLYENDLRRTEYNSSGANSYEPLLVNRGGSYPGGIILKNNGASPSVLSPMGGGVGPGPMAEPNHSNGGATANGNGNPYSIVEGSGAVAVMNSGGGVFSGDQLALVEMNQNYNSKGLLVDGNSGNGNGNGNGNAGENEGDDDMRGNTRKKAAAGEKSRRRKKK